MRHVVINFPDNKYNLFLELLKQLNIEEVEMQEIPEFQKEIVRSRIKNSEKNPENLLDWETVKNDFQFD